MTESQMLFQTTATLLLLGLLTHLPSLYDRLGRAGFVALALGATIPLADIPLNLMLSSDRIDYLAKPAFFSGFFFGFLLISVLSTWFAFWRDFQSGGRVFVLLSGGYLVRQTLALLTSDGITPFAPISGMTVSLPILPSMHLPLIILLLLVIVILEIKPFWHKPLLIGATLLAGAYLLAGVSQYTWFRIQADSRAEAGELISVAPADPWMARWLVTATSDQRYRSWIHGVDMGPLSDAEELAKWQDEAMLIQLLGDPTVHRFFFHKFQHPVARSEFKDNRLVLTIRELVNMLRGEPGPTFTLELEQPELSRTYRVAHFD